MIYTIDAPPPIGAYSQARKVGNLVFLSGQIGLHPQTGELVSKDFEPQLLQIFQNISAVVKAANGSLKDVVKLTIFVLDLQNFPVVNEIIQQTFPQPYPARSVVGVSSLPKLSLVEVEAILAFSA